MHTQFTPTYPISHSAEGNSCWIHVQKGEDEYKYNGYKANNATGDHKKPAATTTQRQKIYLKEQVRCNATSNATDIGNQCRPKFIYSRYQVKVYYIVNKL